MIDFDVERFHADTRARALDEATRSLTKRANRCRATINDFFKMIREEFESAKEEERACVDFFEAVAGSAYTHLVRDQAIRLFSDLLAPRRERADAWNIDLMLTFNDSSLGHDSATSVPSRPSGDPSPDVPGSVAPFIPDEALHMEPRDLPIRATLDDDSVTCGEKRSVDRLEEVEQPVPKRINLLTKEEQYDVYFQAIQSRFPVQKTDVEGKAFCFELPAGSGHMVVIKCSDCDAFLKPNVETHATAIENHWLISKWHKDYNKSHRVYMPAIESVLEQHTYRVEGADLEWARRNNTFLRNKLNKLKKTTNPSASKGGRKRAHKPFSRADETPEPFDCSQPSALSSKICVTCASRDVRCDRHIPCGKCRAGSLPCDLVEAVEGPNSAVSQGISSAGGEGSQAKLSELRPLASFGISGSSVPSPADDDVEVLSDDELQFLYEQPRPRDMPWVMFPNGPLQPDDLISEFKTEPDDES